jgi:hypothetical protein
MKDDSIASGMVESIKFIYWLILSFIANISGNT